MQETHGIHRPSKTALRDGSTVPVAGHALRDTPPVSLCSKYGLDPKQINEEWLPPPSKTGIAVGIEALKHAKLVAAEGTPSLPEVLRGATGIIFGSAYATEGFVLEHARRWREDPDNYVLSHSYIINVTAKANAHLAAITGARGPNLRVDAACSCTTTAISVAHDWLATGRADRVLLVGADDITDPVSLPWLLAGFNTLGVGSLRGDHVPMGVGRDGPVMATGGVGIVLEAGEGEEARARGATPLARLLCSRISNAAGSPVSMSHEHMASELNNMLDEAERRYGLTRRQIARSLVYFAYESATPACADYELKALRAAFGDIRDILVYSPKRQTGHTMGANLEEALAVMAVGEGVVLPPPDYEVDPALGADLRTDSRGEAFRFGLRFASGFGSQYAYNLYESCHPNAPPRLAAQWADRHFAYQDFHLSAAECAISDMADRALLMTRLYPERRSYELQDKKT